MQNFKERKRFYRAISWILATMMVITTINFGGIPASKVEAADYDSGEIASTSLVVGDILKPGVKVTLGDTSSSTFFVYFGTDSSHSNFDQNNPWVPDATYKVVEIVAPTYGDIRVEEVAATTLTSDNTSFVETEFGYDGTAKTPTIQYKASAEAGAVDLTANTDYTVSAESTTSATNAGEYSVTITGTGDYTGSVTLSWKINPITLTSENVKLKDDVIYYTENNVTNVVQYVSGEEDAQPVDLVSGTDFNLNGKLTAKNAGEYNVSLTGKGNYTGTVSNLKWSIKKIPVTVTPKPGQSKTYGTLEDILEYTVSVTEPEEPDEGYVPPVIPEEDLEDGMFKKGSLKYKGGEAVGEHEYDISDLKNRNKKYDITLDAGEGTEESPLVTFEITRKQLTDDDILVVAKNSSGKTDENGFEYAYTGKAITAQFDLYYTTRKVADDGKIISGSFEPKNPSSSKNNAYKLTNDTDYVFTGTTSAKQPNKTLEIDPFDIKFRGEGNYQGNIADKWSVVANTFRVKETVYEGEYDGEEHEALEVHPSPSRDYKDESKTFEYILIGKDEMSVEGFDRQEVLNDPEAAWINFVDKASSEVPMIKDVLVDEDGDAQAYIVLYKITMNGYEDVYGAVEPMIEKLDVELVANDTEPKVYDNNPETDPELIYEDFADDVLTEDYEAIKAAVKISREEGQDADEYDIYFNIDELNEKFTNYDFDEDEGIFEITKRTVNVSVDSFEKVYSDEFPEVEVKMDKAGDEGVAEDEGVIAGDEDQIQYQLKYTKGRTDYNPSADLDVGEYEIQFRRRVTNKNYNLVFGEDATLTVTPKDIGDEGTEEEDIPDENIKVVFNGETDEKFYVCEFTGEKITPTIALQHFVDDYNFMKYGNEKTARRTPDYRIIGIESATDIGVYKVTIEGLNNYTGTRTFNWFILPMDIDTEATYNGTEQSPDFKGEFDPENFKNLFKIEYSESLNEDFTDEMPSYKDVAYDEDDEVTFYPIFYRVTFNPDEYGADEETGDAYEFVGATRFTIKPAELKANYIYDEKEYDGDTAIRFEDIEAEGVTYEDEKGGEVTEKFTVSFDAELDEADSDYVLDVYDEYIERPVKVSKTQMEAAEIKAIEGSDFKPSNYVLGLDLDEEGYVVDSGAVVNRKILYDYDPEDEEQDGYMFGYAEDREYDGTPIADATIEVDTGIEGETITFENTFAESVDAADDGDVIIGEDGTPKQRDVEITGVAVAGEGTKLGNYAYYDAKDKVTYSLDITRLWEGLITVADEDEDDEEAGIWAGHIDSTLLITPAVITVSGEDITKVYDGKEIKAADVKATVSGFDGIIDEVSEYYDEHKDGAVGFDFLGKSAKNAGEYTVQAYIDDDELADMLDDNPNYLVKEEEAKVTITPKPVTVKALDATKVEGEADPTFKYTVDGLADGETLKNIKVTRKAGDAAGTYDIYITCDADPNYNITFTGAKLTITKKAADYKNEWVDGQWYDANGKTDYKPQGSWKQNDKGWWYEDESGWYPVNCWQKIDGVWYHFKFDGYMAASEWIEGYWLDADGGWRYEPKGSWKQDSTGWWYEDTAGWYPQNQWQKIDNIWYYFGADGYLVTNQYVGEYWVNANGEWAE